MTVTGSASRPHHDGVAIHELQASERAFEKKLVEIDFLQNFVSPLHRHVSVAALFRIDTSRPAQVVEKGVGGHTGVAAGRVHIARHIHDYRAGAFEIRVHINILSENSVHRVQYSFGKNGVADTCNPDRTDLGNENVSLARPPRRHLSSSPLPTSEA